MHPRPAPFAVDPPALNNNGEYGDQRAVFNGVVRGYAAAHGKPLFDLAALESHDPDGRLAEDASAFGRHASLPPHAGWNAGRLTLRFPRHEEREW